LTLKESCDSNDGSINTCGRTVALSFGETSTK
jgi:hypothetical protein